MRAAEGSALYFFFFLDIRLLINVLLCLKWDKDLKTECLKGHQIPKALRKSLSIA